MTLQSGTAVRRLTRIQGYVGSTYVHRSGGVVEMSCAAVPDGRLQAVTKCYTGGGGGLWIL
jgi:hypothetical protein